jgi:hypothetical protein
VSVNEVTLKVRRICLWVVILLAVLIFLGTIFTLWWWALMGLSREIALAATWTLFISAIVAVVLAVLVLAP